MYVIGRKKKAFFVDGMTDHFDNFIKRMEKEGKEIILPETKKAPVIFKTKTASALKFHI